MSVETYRVLIGSNGWQHAGWQTTFYDEDLPPEWQLGFYANEFPVVYLDAADWLDNDAVADWVEDVSEHFRFVVALPLSRLVDSRTQQQVMQQLQYLQEHCLAVVLQGEPALFMASLAVVDSLLSDTAVVLDPQGASAEAEILAVLQQRQIALLRDENTPLQAAHHHGRVAVCRLSATTLAMPALRQVVEDCLALSDEQCISTLFVQGQPPSLEMMRNADVILNLL